MANGINGITIEFKGDTTQLGKALSSVNKQIRETDSALREVDKALKLDPTNAELLAQKEALLAKQVEQVADKLDLQQSAAVEAAQALEEGTISQEEYAKLAAQISETSSRLGELESEATGAAGELDEAADSAGDVADSAEEAGESAESSADSFADWGDAISSAASAAAGAVAAVTAAVAAAATALGATTIQTASLADEVLTLSTVTGISTETLQAMNYASELLDVSTDTMTGSMTRLLRTMNSANEGSESALEGFESLGVSITDEAGNLRDNEAVFWDVIDALGQIDNETERDAAAMELLGRSAQELNPLIEAGSGAFEELRAEAEETGYIMSGDTLSAFGALDDNMQRLSNGAEAARNAIGGVLLPVLTDLSGEGVSLLNEFTNAVLDTDGDVSQLGEVIDTMVPQVLSLLDEYLPVLFELGTSIIGSLASSILDNLPLILDSAGSLILALAQGIIDHLGDGELASTITSLILSLVNFLVSNLPTVVSAATQIIIAVTQGLASAAPDLIPAIVDCIILMNETMLQNLDVIISAAQQLLLGIIEGLVLATPDILAAIPTLISEMLEEFGQLGPELASNALEWGIDMVQNLIDGVRSMFGNLSDAASNLASCISDYLHFSVPEKGPLADFDESGSDMIDTFINSMNSEDAALERALIQQGNIIYNGMTNDYSGQLDGIASQLGNLRPSGNGMPPVINVYMGTSRVGSVVVDAMNSEYYLSGGN